ncbi:MAG: glycosyl hydrolase family 25 [Bacteroidaceae bacterium]|nr:glycosyl hydrolase family 25 [Bacteroidaceae bacterium]
MKRYLLILLLTACTALCLSAKTIKRKAQLPAPPEPDAMALHLQPDRGLPDQQEPGSTDVPVLKWREGIDVSHYQYQIDWQRVAQEGQVGYAYIKATEGAELQDEYYRYNIEQARHAGIRVGSYHFFRAHVPLDQQLSNMTSVVKAEEQDMLPLIDVESLNRVKPAEMVRRLKVFLQRVTAHYGKKPAIYTFVNFYNKYLAGAGLEDYPLMIAFYRDAQPELRDGRKYVIWQYTASGDVPGVDGEVDRSILMDEFQFSDISF